jgi:hypothetical protein
MTIAVGAHSTTRRKESSPVVVLSAGDFARIDCFPSADQADCRSARFSKAGASKLEPVAGSWFPAGDTDSGQRVSAAAVRR